MKGKKIGFTFASLVAALSLSACGGSNAKLTAIDLSADIHDLVVADEELGGAVIDVDFTGSGDFGTGLTWTSSDETVATVEDGVVVAMGLGNVEITATSTFNKKVSDSIDFSVVPAHVEAIDVSASSAYLIVGHEDFGTAELMAEVTKYGEAAPEDIDWKSLNTSVATVAVDEDGVATVTGVAAGETQLELTAGTGDYIVKKHIDITVKPAGSLTPATGGFSYVDSSGADRTKILAILEEYAMRNHITGISIMGNGGYSMVADGVTRGSDTYIPGYGFGVLSDGDITKPLTGKGVTEKWNMYFHTYEVDDPKTVNYMNDKGSVVGDLIGYHSGSYFGTFMNEEKNGYDWVADLATEDRPILVDENGEPVVGATKGTHYRIPLKTSEVKYQTLTKNSKLAAFNNRPIELEDYLTPYKVYYTQAYGMARGNENLTGAGSIKGAAEYYKASEKGFDQAAFDKLGIHTYTDGDEKGLEFEFNTPCTPFYAMYYLASGMFAPVPEDFILELGGGLPDGGDKEAIFKKGVNVWGCFKEDNGQITLTPVDTTLSSGPYTIEEWKVDEEIVWKKNANYETRDPDHYAIEGVHVDILKAMSTDPEAALNEFLAGNLSSVGIPSTKKDEWIGKPGVLPSKGDSNFKLNVNTCNEEQWEALFGVNGTICQTPKGDYWEVEPALSNPDFVDALSFAIDRADFAENLGRTMGFEYFADTYMSDPEAGIAYNYTDEHQQVLANLGYATTQNGYSEEQAIASFDKALTALLAEGAYKDGDTIELEIAWQEFSDEQTYHALIKGYIEKAFNKSSVAKAHNLKLNCKFWASNVWSDVYYAKMMIGQFDLGFGSVSGNSYDPLNFLEVLKSDNSSGFTLNWGVDTNTVSDEIEWDGHVWSFAGLWQAADTGAYIENGVVSELVQVGWAVALDEDEDGNITVVFPGLEKIVDEDTWGEIYAACIFGTNDLDAYSDYAEYYLFRWDEDGEETGSIYIIEEGELAGYYAITITAEELAEFAAMFDNGELPLMCGFDVYYIQSICGNVSSEPIFLDTVVQWLNQ